MDSKTVQRNIMRRVYYSFGLSIVSHAMFWRGVFLGAAALLLAQWLHVASIINNVLAVPVGAVPQYVANSMVGAATHGEFLTVLMFVLAGIIGMSCLWRLGQTLVVTPKLAKLR